MNILQWITENELKDCKFKLQQLIIFNLFFCGRALGFEMTEEVTPCLRPIKVAKFLALVHNFSFQWTNVRHPSMHDSHIRISLSEIISIFIL